MRPRAARKAIDLANDPWRAPAPGRGSLLSAAQFAGNARLSPLPVQRAEQREQAPGRGDIDGDLALEPLLQQAAPFVVQAPAPHVDRLDPRGRLRLDRLI